MSKRRISKWLFGAELAGWPGQGVGVGTGAVVGGSGNTDAEFKGYPCQGWLGPVWGCEQGHWWVVVGMLMLNSKGILVKGGLLYYGGYSAV